MPHLLSDMSLLPLLRSGVSELHQKLPIGWLCPQGHGPVVELTWDPGLLDPFLEQQSTALLWHALFWPARRKGATIVSSSSSSLSLPAHSERMYQWPEDHMVNQHDVGHEWCRIAFWLGKAIFKSPVELSDHELVGDVFTDVEAKELWKVQPVSQAQLRARSSPGIGCWEM